MITDAETLSAEHPQLTLTQAARELGSFPKLQRHGHRKTKRIWTGFIGRQRMWVDRPVSLKSGELALVLKVVRGQAILQSYPNGLDQEPVIIQVRCDDLTVYKDPAAVALGRLKRGCIEKKSAKKAESCRRNGKRPIRFLSRLRGRPNQDRGLPMQFNLGKNAMKETGSRNAMINRMIKADHDLKRAYKIAGLGPRTYASWANVPAYRPIVEEDLYQRIKRIMKEWDADAEAARLTRV